MGIKAKILKELQKKPRRLKELKAKLGNDKKVARAVDELVERNKVVCRKGVYAVPDPKTGNAVECTLVKLAGKFGFARPVQPDGQDIFIPGKYLMGAMPGDTLLVSLFEHPRVEGSSEGVAAARVGYNEGVTLNHICFFDRGRGWNGKVERGKRTYRYAALIQKSAGLAEVNVFAVLCDNRLIYRRKFSVEVQYVKYFRN